MNWRACPASPRFRPPIHPPTTLFLQHFLIWWCCNTLGATHKFGPCRSPLYLPNALRRCLVAYDLQATHTLSFSRAPTITSNGARKSKRVCAIAQQQTDKGGVAIEPRSHLFPPWRGCSHVQEPVWWVLGSWVCSNIPHAFFPPPGRTPCVLACCRLAWAGVRSSPLSSSPPFSFLDFILF